MSCNVIYSSKEFFSMTHEELLQVPEELRELFVALDRQGWNPQLCDTPVPYYENAVPCGEPAEAGDITRGEYTMLPCDGADIDTTFVVNVRGNSMVDAGIEAGDRLEVLSTHVVDDGDIVLASIDGEYTVKALFIDDQDRYWLVPRNNAYDPILISDHDDAVIVGRVIGIHKQVRRAGHREMRNLVTQSPIYAAALCPSSTTQHDDTAPFTDEELRQAIAKAYKGTKPTSTDWIAAYYVLVDRAGAPQSFAGFAAWANALDVEGMPSCKADLLRKADPIYLKPLYRWSECDTVRECILTRRLSIAKVLRGLLTR